MSLKSGSFFAKRKMTFGRKKIKMKNSEKYTRNYFLPPELDFSFLEKDYLDKPPIWCSVDLRDGNQALVVPMSLEEKLNFFRMLTDIGFREIEVGFPAASDTEYEFLRVLIERELIPEGVTLQVLTQARPHIIRRTFEALAGCPSAIVHLYNATSAVQRERVFRADRAEIRELAVRGAALLAEEAAASGLNCRFEYSPESFTGTEPEFALEVCNAVLETLPKDKPVIINLPVTVSLSMPHVYAAQVRYLHKNLIRREQVVLSLHPHNDRGCAVADAELGLLAGAQRVEGTLFGNGERTGNADLVTLALNLYAQGVDPGLDLSDLPAVSEAYENATRMEVPPRQPYGGRLVFAAFSGSHQDAIAKSMAWREEHHDPHWNVPYLPLDPRDIGRDYETDVIRINSQSGKGGIGYLLEHAYGFHLPARLRETFSAEVKHLSDQKQKELKPEEVFRLFRDRYLDKTRPLEITECHFAQVKGFTAIVSLKCAGREDTVTRSGNGRLDAVSNALKAFLGLEFTVELYTEHALEEGSSSRAVAYVGIRAEGELWFGAAVHPDIITASANALVSALNNLLAERSDLLAAAPPGNTPTLTK